MTDIISFTGQYAFLSNFTPNTIGYSVEHEYQAAKATNEQDRNYILFAATPGEAKKRGRKIKTWYGWEDSKLDIMRKLLEIKFSDRKFRCMLLGTKNRQLIEGNWWGDTFWGQCPIGVGENNLGKLLMELRYKLDNSRIISENEYTKFTE